MDGTYLVTRASVTIRQTSPAMRVAPENLQGISCAVGVNPNLAQTNSTRREGSKSNKIKYGWHKERSRIKYGWHKERSRIGGGKAKERDTNNGWHQCLMIATHCEGSNLGPNLSASSFPASLSTIVQSCSKRFRSLWLKA